MLTCFHAGKKDCMLEGMTAIKMSCLQASLQDGLPDVMQAGWKDGWHCIHCE
jgi:hypothetical protein